MDVFLFLSAVDELKFYRQRLVFFVSMFEMQMVSRFFYEKMITVIFGVSNRVCRTQL